MKTNRPSWASERNRIALRPNVDGWYRPEEGGPVEGILVWRGEHESPLSDGPRHIFCLQLDDGKVLAINEYQRLRDVRSLPLGTRLYLEPKGKVSLPGGRTMHDFEVFAEAGRVVEGEETNR